MLVIVSGLQLENHDVEEQGLKCICLLKRTLFQVRPRSLNSRGCSLSAR